MIRKFISASVMSGDDTLTDRQIRVRASNGVTDRAGDVLVPRGCVTQSGTVPFLLDHDASIKSIVGSAVITVSDSSVEALVTFLPLGMAANADDACAKYKNGFANAVSVGFDAIDYDKTKTGLLFRSWELLELSGVAVGCNQEALVTAKSLVKTASDWKIGASKSLPTSDDDGPAAAKAILDAAGFDGDNPDSMKARKGFLTYDAANPTLRSSYTLPFTRMVDGKLTVTKTSVESAALGLLQADIPDDVRAKACALLGHYKEKLGMTTSGKGSAPRVTKGLYQCSQLADLLGDLSWVQDCVEYEAEYEGDGSPVPAMLADIMRAMGDALIAMTTEEVNELFRDDAEDAQKTFRASVVKSWGVRVKAGRTVSNATADKLKVALASHNDAMVLTKAAMAAHQSGIDCIKGLLEPGAEGNASDDGDVTETQSTGTVTSDKSFSRRQREAEMLALAVS